MTGTLREIWMGLPRRLRRGLAAIAGGSVLSIGLVMLIAPGPAVVVIPCGLSILAAEFAWARHLLRRAVPERWHPPSLRETGAAAPAPPGSLPRGILSRQQAPLE